MTEREALKLALDALEINHIFLKNVKPCKGQENLAFDCVAMTDETITAIKEVLAQPEQEPVATVQCINGVTIGYLDVMQPVGTKLYTTPPQRKPLTVCKTCNGTGIVKGLHNWATGGKREEACWNCYREDA